MKNIIIHKDGKVIDCRSVSFDITADNLAVIDTVPPFVPRDGFSGTLCYSETEGLYWEYVENEAQIDPVAVMEEKALAYDIITGVAE